MVARLPDTVTSGVCQLIEDRIVGAIPFHQVSRLSARPTTTCRDL